MDRKETAEVLVLHDNLWRRRGRGPSVRIKSIEHDRARLLAIDTQGRGVTLSMEEFRAQYEPMRVSGLALGREPKAGETWVQLSRGKPVEVRAVENDCVMTPNYVHGKRWSLGDFCRLWGPQDQQPGHSAA